MDLDHYTNSKAERIDLKTDDHCPGTVEGVCLGVGRRDFDKMCQREASDESARVRSMAPGSIGDYLWELYIESRSRNPDWQEREEEYLGPMGWLKTISNYRKKLVCIVGGTSKHYMPHPIRVDEGRTGVVFIAPSRRTGGTGGRLDHGTKQTLR